MKRKKSNFTQRHPKGKLNQHMVTIKDISKALGVSPATVSKALNGYSDINPQTAERIRAAAKEMHYLPNIAARQLKTNRSHNIGVLFVDATNSGLTHEYFAAILNSAKETFEMLGYDVTFISDTIAGTKASFLEHARYRNCDGVLIASVDFTSPQVVELVNSEIPTVTIDYPFSDKSAVMSDNVEGQYELTKYVLEMGHRRIGLIHGEMTMVTKKRLNGFRRALKEFGVELNPMYEKAGAFHDTKRTAEMVRELMALPEPPTILMCPDDYAALGALTELEKMGLRIPEDISVTGYDGISLSQVLRPKLTTYFQDSTGIGHQSARKLVEEIEEKDSCTAEQIMIRGKLLQGHSVKDLREEA